MTRTGTTITTVAELDALPIKTIIMDAHQRGFQKFTNGWEPTGIGQAFSRCATPATVLHEPGEPTRPLPDRDTIATAIEDCVDGLNFNDSTWEELDAAIDQAADAVLELLKGNR